MKGGLGILGFGHLLGRFLGFSLETFLLSVSGSGFSGFLSKNKAC